jgi:ubiquinone/menaquinone biosynthesis C-methylase UbiE
MRDRVLGLLLIVLGLLVGAAAYWLHDLSGGGLAVVAPHVAFSLAIASFAALLAGLLLVSGLPVRIRVHEWEINTLLLSEHSFSTSTPAPPGRAQRQEYTARKQLPGSSAPALNILEDRSELRVGPVGDPSIASYVLDRNFRIVDWNEAFSLSFDRTMEGRRGMSVLEWTYFLDNYEEVVDHGIKVFGGEGPLPPIDVETIRYTSKKYGPLTAIKRAYRIPNDDGDCTGWLVLLDVDFATRDVTMSYQRDLVGVLARDVMWSEYALSYDTVLMNTDVYPKLLADMLGKNGGGLTPIARNATVLDLGAGTGNLTEALMAESPGRIVVALENNRTMLAVLRAKMRSYMRGSNGGAGVVALKQDITTLLGLEDDYFDVALMNNVLYSVDDAVACLREVCRVLRPGGEVRISGPQKRTRLHRVLRAIKRDLKAKGIFNDVAQDFERVRIINERRLAQWLYKWNVDDVRNILRDSGFSDVFYANDRAYAGESMLVAARK